MVGQTDCMRGSPVGPLESAPMPATVPVLVAVAPPRLNTSWPGWLLRAQRPMCQGKHPSDLLKPYDTSELLGAVSAPTSYH